MRIKHSNFLKRVIALMLCIGALPIFFCARTYAEESRWFDDYKQPVGFTYNAQARIQASYLWRGLYAGGANIQASANVGYGGLYFDMWWNIGVTDWTFKTFQPEVDFSLGFSRWGLDVYFLYIYNFECGFFNFEAYPANGGTGNRLEMNVRYTLNSKIPLSFLWASRIAASDHYINAAGDTVRAYSSYAEISYTQKLPDGWSIYGAIGMTPWRGCYNARGAALQNIEVRLRKDWTVAKRCGMMVQGQMAVNPMAPLKVINLNLTYGVYLK